MKKTNTTVPIKHIAKLANLNLTDEQLKTYENHLGSILDLMQEITSMDLDNVAFTSRVIDEENMLREDVIKESFSQAEALQNTTHAYQGYFMVDAILDKGEN